MTHHVTVTALSGEDRDKPEYEVGGDCADDPVVYNPCTHKKCAGKATHGYYRTEVRHGKDHILWEGNWCVETKECPLNHVEDLHFAVDEFGRLGTFPLEIEWDESWTATPFDDGSDADA